MVIPKRYLFALEGILLHLILFYHWLRKSTEHVSIISDSVDKNGCDLFRNKNEIKFGRFSHARKDKYGDWKIFYVNTVFEYSFELDVSLHLYWRGKMCCIRVFANSCNLPVWNDWTAEHFSSSKVAVDRLLNEPNVLAQVCFDSESHCTCTFICSWLGMECLQIWHDYSEDRLYTVRRFRRFPIHLPPPPPPSNPPENNNQALKEAIEKWRGLKLWEFYIVWSKTSCEFCYRSKAVKTRRLISSTLLFCWHFILKGNTVSQSWS